jgi:hypothetical protein
MTSTEPGETASGSYDQQTLTGYVSPVQTTRGESTGVLPTEHDTFSGVIYRYEMRLGRYVVGGMMDTLSGTADVEVRNDETDEIIISELNVDVERWGLARFEYTPIAARSLALLALRAITWAEGAEAMEDSRKTTPGASEARESELVTSAA